ncbi:MAG: hypothetical protein A2Y38_00040 [Spirochaetes bacterium GWB1_59_5]|nr:MAG: hypothetical protein A2Y38_00040 [Spirochaetes bacterium GWB1_59_5]
MDAPRMYIILKAGLEPGMAVLSAAHAAVSATLAFRDQPETQQWTSGIFYKVICEAYEKEFEEAKKLGPHVLMTESSLGGKEVALGFPPMSDPPKRFKYFRLYK